MNIDITIVCVCVCADDGVGDARARVITRYINYFALHYRDTTTEPLQRLPALLTALERECALRI